MAISKQSSWQDGKRKTVKYPALLENIEVDVAIVGGGLAGVLTAYRLAQLGRSVALLEAETLGSGATLLTTAFLTQSIDTDYTDLVSMFGRAKAKQILESHQAGLDYIEELVKKEKIDCDFKRVSNDFYANEPEDLPSLEEEYQEMANDGFNVVFKKAKAKGFKNAGYLELKDQAKFHPIQFLQAIAEKAAANGVQIYEKTTVNKIDDGKQVVVRTDGGKVKCQKVIVCTYDPLGNPKQTFAKKGMYVTYVMEAKIPSGLIKEGIYEDSANPYHYFRIDRGEGFDYIMLGGKDHRQEIPSKSAKNFQKLEEYLDELLGDIDYEIIRKWSGPILEPSDGLALIGEYKQDHYLACAFSGNGMTYSAITSLMLPDIIAGKKHRWRDIYSPTRKPSAKQLAIKARDYGGELLDLAKR